MNDGLNIYEVAHVEGMRKKLDDLRQYVQEMAPVIFAAILESPAREGYKKGYGDATRHAQEDLLAILDEEV